MNYARKVLFVGDDEGEIELTEAIKTGWEPVRDRKGKIIINDGMVVIQKLYRAIVKSDPLKPHLKYPASVSG